MTDDDRIVVAGGNSGTEAFPVLRLKGLAGGHQDIGCGIKLEILRCPLFRQVVGDNDHALMAETEPLALLCRGNHFKGLAGTHNMRQKRIAAVEDMGDSVHLMRPKLNFPVLGRSFLPGNPQSDTQ